MRTVLLAEGGRRLFLKKASAGESLSELRLVWSWGSERESVWTSVRHWKQGEACDTADPCVMCGIVKLLPMPSCWIAGQDLEMSRYLTANLTSYQITVTGSMMDAALLFFHLCFIFLSDMSQTLDEPDFLHYSSHCISVCCLRFLWSTAYLHILLFMSLLGSWWSPAECWLCSGH